METVVVSKNNEASILNATCLLIGWYMLNKINNSKNFTLILMLFIFFTYVGFQPFSLGVDENEAIEAGVSNLSRQFVFIVFFLISLYFFLINTSAVVRVYIFQKNMGLLILLAWCLISIVWSDYPIVTFKRVALLFLSTFTLLFLVTLIEFDKLVIGVSKLMAAMIVVSIVSVFFIETAVHNSAEIINTDLQGNWRGIFSHKNDAAPAAVLGAFFFYTAFLINKNKFWLFMVLVSLIFVYFTKSKTSLAFFFPAMLFGLFSVKVVRKQLLVKILTVLFIVSAAFLILLSESLVYLFEDILMDPEAFTGRSTIWDMMFSAIKDSPMLGYGYGAVWSIDERTVLTNYEFGRVSWVFLLTQGHNSYLDIILSIGFIGLLLFLFAFIVQPFINADGFSKRPAHLVFLFWSTLFFMIFHSLLETNFLLADKGRWVLFLLVFFSYRLDSGQKLKMRILRLIKLFECN